MNTYSAKGNKVLISFNSPDGIQEHEFALVLMGGRVSMAGAASNIAEALNEKEARETHRPCGERHEHCRCLCNIGGTISEGTLRDEDLIPVFMRELAMLDPTLYQNFLDCQFPVEEKVEELIQALDSCAGEGLCFGAHPGDGADFGFWRHEED